MAKYGGVRKVFERLDIDPARLYLNDLQWYEEHSGVLEEDAIKFSTDATSITTPTNCLSATVNNLVVSSYIKTKSDKMINIKRIYYALSDYGFELNPTKLSSTYARFFAPIDCKVTIYASGVIDCKGARTFLTVYLALEYVFALLRDRVYNGRQDAFTVTACNVSNVVVTGSFDFQIPVKILLDDYPDRCVSKTPENRIVMRRSAALFQGAIFTVNLANGRESRLLFQDHAWVTCVGCRTFEETRTALEQFYSIAKAAKTKQIKQQQHEMDIVTNKLSKNQRLI